MLARSRCDVRSQAELYNNEVNEAENQFNARLPRFLHLDNVPTHTATPVQEFLAGKNKHFVFS